MTSMKRKREREKEIDRIVDGGEESDSAIYHISPILYLLIHRTFFFAPSVQSFSSCH